MGKLEVGKHNVKNIKYDLIGKTFKSDIVSIMIVWHSI